MDLRRVRYRQQLIEVFSVGQVHSSEAVAGLLHEPGRLEDAVAKASAESLTCPTPERECVFVAAEDEGHTLLMRKEEERRSS